MANRIAAFVSAHAALRPLALVVASAMGLSGAAEGLADPGRVWVSVGEITQGPDAIRVVARAATLENILDAIAQKAGIRIHYSGFSNVPRNTDCSGDTYGAVIGCVLGRDADFLVREPDGKRRALNQTSGEAWILASTAADSGTSRSGVKWPEEPSKSAVKPSPQGEETDPEAARQAEVKRLLEQANGAEGADRASALSQLTAVGKADDQTLVETYQARLDDEDAAVRAQAIFGLSQHGGPAAIGALREALHDRDPDVRLMAVDSAATDADGQALLQSALGDDNPTIRELAASKLQSVNTGGESRNN